MPNEEVVTFDPSSLETIDRAVYKFVNETINAHATTNKGFSKTPVLWLGTERPYQIKNNKSLRDEVGKLILPLITVTRTSVVRDEWKGSYQAYFPIERGVPGGVPSITKTVLQRKTRNFANTQKNRQNPGEMTGRLLDESTGDVRSNTQIVYETITIPKPTYITCMFEVNIRTEYQQQMNELIPPFIIDQKNIYPIELDGHRYELFIQDDYGLSDNLANLQSEERMFNAKIQFKVLGYLIGDGPNRDRPAIIKKQGAAKIVVGEPRVVDGIPGPNGLQLE